MVCSFKEGEGFLSDLPPVISVVVVNWNGLPVIESCLESILCQTYQPLEVIVVDNGSGDGSPDLVRNRFPHVRLIVNGKNLGFGGGNNIGIRASQGQYIMVLNNDTRLDPRCIELLMQSLERDQRFGASTPKILLNHEDNLIDAAGIAIYPDGLSIGRGRLEPGERYDEETEVFCASGCAGLFRREMLDEIGLFDEDFFAYAEDTDLGWRARLAGWKAYYVPQAIVYHHHSKIFGTYSTRKAFLVERNRIWVALKNFPPSLLCLLPFYTLLRYFYQGIGTLIHKGAAGRFAQESSPLPLIPITIRANLSGLKGLRMILKKRREIQGKKKISHQEFYRLFKKYGIKAKEIAFKE
jgi:GT2 family glycosyltransferase